MTVTFMDVINDVLLRCQEYSGLGSNLSTTFKYDNVTKFNLLVEYVRGLRVGGGHSVRRRRVVTELWSRWRSHMGRDLRSSVTWRRRYREVEVRFGSPM